MSDLDSPPRSDDPERQRIIRSRNRVMALLLVGFVVLVFAISLARMH
jgi:hypothetical protein